MVALTEKQKAIEEVTAELKKDPTLSIGALCEKHGVSPAYFYNHRKRLEEQSAAKKSKGKVARVKNEVVTYRVNDLAPSVAPSSPLIPPGYAAVVILPSDQLMKGFLFGMRGGQ